MTTWKQFAMAAPDLAAAGRALLCREGHGGALLATVRDAEPPRLHPISVGIVAAGWFFEADAGYELFEFEIESAVIGERPTANDWPPRYTTWRAAADPGMG